MNEIIGWLRVLFTPSCWITIDPYSKAWDRELKALMSYYRFRRIAKNSAHWFPGVDQFEVMLGGKGIWIANHPYASFQIPGDDVRARRITVLRAMDKLKADLYRK